VPALVSGADAAARAAFILGDAAFPEAWPRLAVLEGEEARDAREKIAALAGKDGRTRLLALQARSASWDVRRWARERLGGTEWIAVILAHDDAPREALEEAIAAVSSAEDAERVARFVDDPRPSLRIEAAAALLRLTGIAHGREMLERAALDAAIPDDARETAIARLAALVPRAELAAALAPIVVDAAAPPSVRAEAARALDQAEATNAAGALVQALDGEVQHPAAGEPEHDLKLALVAALATFATRDAEEGTALEALGRAAAGDPDDAVRALAIHAAGALDSRRAGEIVKTADEVEGGRDPVSPRARHAALLEVEARSPKDGARLVAIADAACEAPVRSALERLVRAARDPEARAIVVGRLRARGDEGEPVLEVLEGR
jgi:hypothetical protein